MSEGLAHTAHEDEGGLEEVRGHLSLLAVHDESPGVAVFLAGVDEAVEGQRVEDCDEEGQQHGSEVELVEEAERDGLQQLQRGSQDEVSEVHLEDGHQQHPPLALVADEEVALAQDEVLVSQPVE